LVNFYLKLAQANNKNNNLDTNAETVFGKKM